MEVTETDPSPFEKIGVTEYMTKFIKTGKGKNLFEYVYPPINGTREIIVLHEHVTEALSYLRNGHGELVRNMNEAAIAMIFSDTEMVKLQMENRPWAPFKYTNDIPEAVTAPYREFNGPKRTRMNHQIRKSS
jgi:hypothetical protein